MKGHEKFVDECDACHQSNEDDPVFLNSSVDSTLSKSCVGCHGRQEDVNGSCSPVGGGVEVECGSGAGLRRMHDLNVGSGTCSGCHSGDPVVLVGEHVNPFNYGKAGVVMQDACDADGTESYFSSMGLDNDGDGDRDASDSDCQTNTAPTQPGSLSASAVTTNSATVSWIASTDIDNDSITYLVEYRRSGVTPWTSGGSTSNTNRSLSGLDDNQSYDVRVTPSDNTENGTSRTKLNLFTTETINTPPTQPGSLSASALTTSSAMVSWVASTDINDDPITYQVEYRRNGDISWSSGGSTSNTSQPLSGLDDDQSYDVRVTPSDSTENGASITTQNLFTTERINTPPTQPGALSASAVTTRSATINWGASTDIDNDSITYLVEYRRNGDIPWSNGGTTSNTNQPLSGLDDNQSFDVRVTPNDVTEDGASITTPNLFATEIDTGTVFKDGFEGN